MVKSLVLHFLSEAASQDYSFITCVLLDHVCHVNQPDPKFKHNGWSDSGICPFPDQFDGKLGFSGGHYYRHTRNAIQVPHPLVNGLDMLRQETEFDFDMRDYMREAVRHYLQFGNKSATIPLNEWGTFEFNSVHQPVCIFPQGKQDDITSGWNSAEFPAICGDFRGDETVDFFKAMNLPVGSPALQWPSRDDLVPRVSRFCFSLVWC